MPYVGETKVEVAFTGDDENGENIKSINTNAPMKILPPWMIKEGMSYTKEQLGETKTGANMGDKLVELELSDDKKSTIVNNESKNIQDEYVKAYYTAILQRQREQEEMAKAQESTNAITSAQVSLTSTERQVSVKSKRDDYEGEDVEWEEAPPTGSTSVHYKVDLNVEEDDIDWEEG